MFGRVDMKLMLREIRKRAKITQKELADILKVDIKTIGNWERAETAMNMEQAYNCCVALNCTPNDLCGWEATQTETLTPEESQLLDHYRECTDARRVSVMQSAADAVTLSKGERIALANRLTQ